MLAFPTNNYAEKFVALKSTLTKRAYELRSASSDNEIFEDRLLELLDFVVGWYYPTNKVY